MSRCLLVARPPNKESRASQSGSFFVLGVTADGVAKRAPALGGEGEPGYLRQSGSGIMQDNECRASVRLRIRR